jgi:uncharacterized protein YeaO (DUF488 family)
MLKETYVANVKNMRQLYPNAIFIAVTRGSPRFKYDTWDTCLAPSEQLKNDFKRGVISWDEYVPRFLKEMENSISKNSIGRVKELSLERDVFLVCFEKGKECHRFLLLDMIIGKKEVKQVTLF